MAVMLSCRITEGKKEAKKMQENFEVDSGEISTCISDKTPKGSYYNLYDIRMLSHTLWEY